MKPYENLKKNGIKRYNRISQRQKHRAIANRKNKKIRERRQPRSGKHEKIRAWKQKQRRKKRVRRQAAASKTKYRYSAGKQHSQRIARNTSCREKVRHPNFPASRPGELSRGMECDYKPDYSHLEECEPVQGIYPHEVRQHGFSQFITNKHLVDRLHNTDCEDEKQAIRDALDGKRAMARTWKRELYRLCRGRK